MNYLGWVCIPSGQQVSERRCVRPHPLLKHFRYKLAHLFGKEGDQIGYLYDFGDKWYHLIEVWLFVGFNPPCRS